MTNTDLSFDAQHIWHPYTSMTQPIPVFPVARCEGVYIELETGEQLIDGMASWWSVLHGYNQPTINSAIGQQLNNMAHVMFGGLTHKPAVDLCRKLVELTPAPLQKVFLSDSGSVAVEVALKMAIQYWHSKGQSNKAKMVSLRNGYHGDTFGAMSVCDPVTGMHSLFSGFMAQNYFVDAPVTTFHDDWQPGDMDNLRQLLAANHEHIAALILEPIVQGAGGMRFYHPEYLVQCRQLCDQYGVLLIADEIATAFGRTGKMFACEHAGIAPDIMCIGKSLTAGYITLAATLCTTEIAETISQGEAGVFMHGPTYMGNPLACSAANASLALLTSQDWQAKVNTIEAWLKQALAPLTANSRVNDVRVLGAIAVVESKTPVHMARIQQLFVENGVWIRPFGRLIYLMPPYIIEQAHVDKLAAAIQLALTDDSCFLD